MKIGSLSVNGLLEKNGDYGQITGKCRFVRKMRFDYGQISQKRLFVRKFE